MKTKIKYLVYPLAVIIVSLFIIAGCSDDEDEVLPDPDDDTPGIVTDIDGNVYQTVIIGDQEWMAENLRVTRYNTGDFIPTGLSFDDWQNTMVGAFAIYDHNEYNTDGINAPEDMVSFYGVLYNWFTVDDERGLCPEGWSVPSDDDLVQLINYVVAQGYPNELSNPNGAGNALKSCRQVGSPLDGCNATEHPRWNYDDTYYGFNEFGFSALPGGFRATYHGGFLGVGIIGNWWSTSEFRSGVAWFRDMSRSSGSVSRHIIIKSVGFSIRCIKD